MKADLEKLMLLTRTGDEAAREDLVRIGYHWVGGFFNHDGPRIPSGMDRRDLVQEGVLAFMKAAESWDGSGSFNNFACIVVRRRWIDLIRRTAYDKLRANEDALPLDSPHEETSEAYTVSDIPDPSPYGRDPCLVVIEAWERTAIVTSCHLLLEELPERQRQALLRVHGLQQSYEEAAAALNVTVKQLDNALWRGKARIKELTRGQRPPWIQEEVEHHAC